MHSAECFAVPESRNQQSVLFIGFFFINFSLSFINIIDFISFAYTAHLSGIGMKTIVIVM